MNDWERAHRTAQIYKEAYPSGTRVLLVQMSDPYHPVESGMRGTVCFVDDLGTVHIDWDNGRGLGVVPGKDEFRKLTEEELAQELREEQQAQQVLDEQTM